MLPGTWEPARRLYPGTVPGWTKRRRDTHTYYVHNVARLLSKPKRNTNELLFQINEFSVAKWQGNLVCTWHKTTALASTHTHTTHTHSHQSPNPNRQHRSISRLLYIFGLVNGWWGRLLLEPATFAKPSLLIIIYWKVWLQCPSSSRFGSLDFVIGMARITIDKTHSPLIVGHRQDWTGHDVCACMCAPKVNCSFSGCDNFDYKALFSN